MKRENLFLSGFPYGLSVLILRSEVRDDMPRADIRAMTALDALARIYLSKVVLHNNGISRALSLALHAADAADLADLHNLSTLIGVRAGWHDLLLLRDELDDVLRTCIHTGATADAVESVNSGNPVNDMHGIKLACFCAVAEADAGEGAQLAAASAEQHGSAAVFRSVVVEAELGSFFGAAAGDEGHHLVGGIVAHV